MGLSTMLPDTLDQCDEQTKYDYVALLSVIAQADGIIVDEEIAALEARMGFARLPEDRRHELRMMQERENNLDQLIDSLDTTGARLALRDGMLLAAADGDYAEEELAILNRLQERAQLDDSAMERMYDWVVRMWRLNAEGRSILGIPMSGDEDLLGE